MKVAGFIPHWMEYRQGSEPRIGKGLQKVGGRYLINYTLSLLNKSRLIDETCIFASGPKILEFIEPDIRYTFMKRPGFLDDAGVSIEQIISEFLKVSDAEIIVLLHPNSPFLRLETLDACVETVKSGLSESAFTAHEFRKFAWFNGAPLNFSLEGPTPNLKDVSPVLIEQSSLYVFSRAQFERTGKRVHSGSIARSINHFEAHEVNEAADIEIAELIVNSGMYSDL